MKKIYLAGAMSGRKWGEVKKERQDVTAKLNEIGFGVLDPSRGKDMPNEEIITDVTELSDAEIVTRDLHDIETADYLYVLPGSEESAGVLMEMGIAYLLRKPIFLTSNWPLQKLGVWRREIAKRCGGIFKSNSDAISHLEKYWR